MEITFALTALVAFGIFLFVRARADRTDETAGGGTGTGMGVRPGPLRRSRGVQADR